MSRAHWCVIPAAGRGARFGGDIPKQYLEVAGRTVLMHTLDALLSHPFWSLAEPERSAQLLHFMKNACMVGGLLLLSLVAPVARRR